MGAKENFETFLALIVLVSLVPVYRCQFSDFCPPYSKTAYAAEALGWLYFILRFSYLFIKSSFGVVYNIWRLIYATLRFVTNNKFVILVISILVLFFFFDSKVYGNLITSSIL